MRAKIVIFVQSGCIRARSGCIRARWLFPRKWLDSGNSCCNRVKLVVFGQKLLSSGKVALFQQM